MSNVSSDLLTGLLKDVSRTFYKTLRVLPSAIRPQIGLAYLLARTTDTIADTDIVSRENRLDALTLLRERILNTGKTSPLQFERLAEKQTSGAEKTLLLRSEESVKILSTFSEADQERVRDVLKTIISGQELDLNRFAAGTATNIVALTNDAELDDYTYRVAGCVGEFWTKMCRAHLFPNAPLDYDLLIRNGVRFGKGLQYVNILRDLPKDLRQGRCYLPKDTLQAAALKPSDLLLPEVEARFRPLYNNYLDRCEAHLAVGWSYTNSLPRNQLRVRLACAWPVLIGVKTVEKLRRENPLDATKRIKVGRDEIRSIIVNSIALLPFRRHWEGQYHLPEAPFGK
ncbi:MAG: Farnesyl-diphosphate farnesyltransferase [Verrucomicrobiales bacterium]|nr:Farnesyl-diphosphate farnesyltransferase [Verrucomicrobiales bacterium]